MFYLRHFKNFQEAKLGFDRPVSILVGPNGAGKSNLIEAFELLCFIANGRPLHDITDLGREGGLEIRGGLDACASHGHGEFTLGYVGKVTTSRAHHSVTYDVTVRVGKDPRITKESLSIEGARHSVFEILPASQAITSADNVVRYDNHSRGGSKKDTVAAANRSALSQYSRFALNDKKLPETLEIIDAVMEALTPPSVFDPIPKLMRGYEAESETRLARNGYNISPVLAELYRSSIHIEIDSTGKKKQWKTDKRALGKRILDRISQLPDEPFKEFDFTHTKSNDVMFGFRANGDNEPTTARVLSDGTLRALAMLTALETGAKSSTIILEEFDNGVHPSRVQLLTQALFDCAKRNGFNALVTTHNPATLNALTVDQLAAVLLVTKDNQSHETRLIPLPELPGYIEFIEKGRLGDLITRRIYEQHVNSSYEAHRALEMEHWLENLP